jgi:PAS domain S-box-containing protein
MNFQLSAVLFQRGLALTIFILMLTNSAWTLYFLYFEVNPAAELESRHHKLQINSTAKPDTVSDGFAPFLKKDDRRRNSSAEDTWMGRGDGEPEHIVSGQQAGKWRKKSWIALLPVTNIALVLFMTFLYFIHKKIQSNYIASARKLSMGLGNEQGNLMPHDELSACLGQINEYHEGIAHAIENMGEDKKGHAFHTEDKIHLSMLSLENKLQSLATSEKIRSWVNEGIANFAGILRNSSASEETLGYNVLSALVKYLQANQGGFYTLETCSDGQLQLHRIATYAWSKKRFAEKIIGIKDNLCGMAVLEKNHIYLKNVPDDFVEITSGLGEATPREVIILPLIFNDKVFGVIELASFNELADYQIEFLKKVSENIASAISNIEHNKQTNKLLEESQVLTRNLQAQEEELRQNAEELQASQENLERKLKEARAEMEEQIVEIRNEKEKNLAILEGCEDGVVIFDEKGKIEFFNSSAEDIWNTKRDEVLGRNIQHIIPVEITYSGQECFVEYVSNGTRSPLGTRTEVLITDQYSEEIAVLLTLSKAASNGRYTFALFVQQISVELF